MMAVRWTGGGAIAVYTLIAAVLAVAVPTCLELLRRRRSFSVAFVIGPGRASQRPVVWRVSCGGVRSVSVKEVGLIFPDESTESVKARTALGPGLPRAASDAQPADLQCSIDHVVKLAEEAGYTSGVVKVRPYAYAEHVRKRQVGQPWTLLIDSPELKKPADS